jgi:EmrB/QacA subfamily drug resistance transporter
MIEEKITTREVVGFSGLAIASFLGCVDLTIVSTAIGNISEMLHVTTQIGQLTLGVFLLALSMFMVTAGRSADRWGRKRVLLVGILVFTAASAAAALSINIQQLITARFIQGMSCAVLYTSTSTLVESLFPERQRGRAVGLLYSINGLGLAIGPVLGGLLTSAWGWPAIFWLNLPFGLFAGLAVLIAVPESSERHIAPSDWYGQIALAVTLFSLIGVFVARDIGGWHSPAVYALAVFFFTFAVITYIVEKKSKSPLLSPSLFSNRRFAAAITSDFFLAFFYTSALLVLPLYLPECHHMPLQAIGFTMLLVSGTMALTSPRVGKMVDKHGPPPLILFGFGTLALSAVLISVGVFTGVLALVLIGLPLFGLGWGSILGPATVQAMSSVPSGQTGFAVGASWTFHNLGGALGAAVAGSIYGAAHSASGTGSGYVLGLLAVTSIVAVLGVRVLTNSARMTDVTHAAH